MSSVTKLGLIVVAGIVLRLLVMWAIWSNGGSPLIGDEGNYILSAVPLSHGQGIPDLWVWIRAPGYIGFAAAILWLTGGSLWALNLAQALLSAPITVTMYFLGRQTTDDPVVAQRAAIAAAALVAFNPMLLFFDNLFLSEQLYLLLSALFMLCLVSYGREVRRAGTHTWLWLVAAGASGGVAALTRPNLLVFVPLVAAWLLYTNRHRLRAAMGSVALLIAVMAAVILPWSFRNLAHYGRFVLIDTTGAYTFFASNSSLSTDQVMAQLSTVGNLADRQGYEFSQGFSWIMANKVEFAQRVVDRTLTVWSPDPFTDLRYPVRDKIPGAATWERDLFALLVSLTYPILTILIVAGLIFAPRTDLRILVIFLLAAHVATIALTHDEFRYRLAVFGLASVYAGYALARGKVFWPLVSEGRWRVRSIAAVAFGLLFTAITIPLIAPGLVSSVQAQTLSLQAQGETDLAKRATLFEEAAQVDVASSQPLREAAQARAFLGQVDKAASDYEDALFREPDDWRTRALLSALYRDHGNARATKIANAVPQTFNATMQDWAWDCNMQPGTQVDVGGADIGWVKGFYTSEKDALTRSAFRWSTGSAAIKVRLAPAARTVAVRARALPGPHGEPLGVRWRIEGEDMGEIKMDGAWRTYTFELPASASTDRIVVVELTAPARQPSDQDPRQIAVAVSQVSTQ
jgi:hypothetical protein